MLCSLNMNPYTYMFIYLVYRSLHYSSFQNCSGVDTRVFFGKVVDSYKFL